MKKLIKTVDILLAFFCSVVFMLIIIGSVYLPKTVVFYDNQSKIEYMNVFYITKTDEVMTAAVGGKKPETTAELSLLGIIPVAKVDAVEADRKYVNVGGTLVGIRLYTDGLLVVGIDEVVTTQGNISPGELCGIKTGDIITHVNDEIVTSVADFSSLVSVSEGNNISITIKRNNDVYYYSLKPVFSELENKYRCGLWLRDSTAGIGTLTFADQQNKMFAALGHAICDNETQAILTVSDGDILGASINGCVPGEKGATGQIKGSFTSEDFGDILSNCEFGVYGTYSDIELLNGELYPVAAQTEIKTGDAQILSTVSDDGVKSYDIEIEKITYSQEKASRSMVIKVTDDDLILSTGGIVQGMSGSPIIQNGMLVGAVTHVFLNDPERGYGIFAETMISEAERIYEQR